MKVSSIHCVARVYFSLVVERMTFPNLFENLVDVSQVITPESRAVAKRVVEQLSEVVKSSKRLVGLIPRMVMDQ